MKIEKAADALKQVRQESMPSQLRITDIRFADIWDAPMHCILVKVYTNQGLTGYGEVRDFGDRRYALLLKSKLLGENPCNVDKIFRLIKQFGGHSRLGGGVCGIELALWDLAGKAYSVPVYQLLGGKFRDKIRCYCDTDVEGKPDGIKMGEALKKRKDSGFSILKMDLSPSLLYDVPGSLSAPGGVLKELQTADEANKQSKDLAGPPEARDKIRRIREIQNTEHHRTGLQYTAKGLEWLRQYMEDVRSVVGYEIPIAVDHVGHIGLTECIKLGRMLENYNIAWMEDALPWHYTDQYRILRQSVQVPICTGEDIYLKEGFLPLLECGGVSLVHPDILTAGGILETKKIGDMAQEYGVAMAIHMAESPIACMAAAHCAAATENFFALEYHSYDVPWWNELVEGPEKPIVKNGYIEIRDTPGLGIEALNDDVIREHIDKDKIPGMWESTEEWNDSYSHDRIWS